MIEVAFNKYESQLILLFQTHGHQFTTHFVYDAAFHGFWQLDTYLT
jgi:hypothetical protein